MSRIQGGQGLGAIGSLSFNGGPARQNSYDARDRLRRSESEIAVDRAILPRPRADPSCRTAGGGTSKVNPQQPQSNNRGLDYRLTPE